MIKRQIDKAEVFVTKDGSSIRSVMDLSNSPVKKQSLAEAQVPVNGETIRHKHTMSEEIYFFTQGQGVLTIDGESESVKAGDAVLIHPGAGHQLVNTGEEPLKLLCCCSPPYSHEDTELLS